MTIVEGPHESLAAKKTKTRERKSYATSKVTRQETTGDHGRQREATGGNGRQREAAGGSGRQREANGRQRAGTEASSCA